MWLEEGSFFWPSYKMFNVTRCVTQPPYQIIKHTNLLSLRTDDSLAKNRLILLLSGVGG